MRFVHFFVSAAVIIFAAKASAANELSVCNGTTGTVRLAVGYRVGDSWISEGWWQLPPTSKSEVQCAKVYGESTSNNVYLYAKSSSGEQWGSEVVQDGQPAFCSAKSVYKTVDSNTCADGHAKHTYVQLNYEGQSGRVTLKEKGVVEYESPKEIAFKDLEDEQSAPPSRITACNRSTETAYIHVGYFTFGKWYSEGRWVAPPNACVRRLLTNFDRTRAIYLRATNENGTLWQVSGESRRGTFCVLDDPGGYRMNDSEVCPLGFVKKDFARVLPSGEVGAFELAGAKIVKFNPGGNPQYPSQPQLASTTQKVQVGQLDSRCLFRWDDSHGIHKVETIWRWNYQATKTTAKKMEHCIRLDLVGPVDVEGLAKGYMDKCIKEAFDKDRVRHAIELVSAIGADVLSHGATKGGFTAAKLTTYAGAVADNAIDCLTDTDKVTKYVGDQLKDMFNATVHKDSKWIYWDV